MHAHRLFAVALLVVGCSAPQPEPAPDTSLLPFAGGTRLRAHVLDGGDDAIVPTSTGLLGFHDTMLDLDCFFQPTTEGIWRCIGGGDAAVSYADDGCSEPVQVRDLASETTPPRYTYSTDRLGVLDGSYPMDHVAATYRVESATREGMTYLRVGTDCVAQSVRTFSALDALPFDTFVAATRVIEGTGALARTVLHGDDGSRWTFRAYDSARRWDCDVLWEPNGLTCFPANVAWRSGLYFSDTECLAPAAYGTPTDDPVAVLADDVSPVAAYEIGARLDGGSTLRDGPCTGLPVERVVWEIGPEIDLATLPTMMPVDLGTGRLRAHYLSSDDGIAIRPPFDGPMFLDTQRNTECAVQEVNGVLRCVDAGAFETDLTFADASCTQQLVRVTPGVPERALAIVHGPWRANAVRQSVESIHSIHPGTLGPEVYQRADDGTCVSTPIVADASVFFFVGPRVADDEFAVVRERDI